MKLELSRQFLANIGVHLDEETYQALSEHYGEALDNAVIGEIVNELDEQQLEELATYTSKGDEDLQLWISENVPQLKEIVEEEVAILLGEMAENSDKL